MCLLCIYKNKNYVYKRWCQVKRKNKQIFLHQCVKKCEINKYKELKQHEHYLCKEFNKQRISEIKSVFNQ